MHWVWLCLGRRGKQPISLPASALLEGVPSLLCVPQSLVVTVPIEALAARSLVDHVFQLVETEAKIPAKTKQICYSADGLNDDVFIICIFCDIITCYK
jgi:hypothetical protein